MKSQKMKMQKQSLKKREKLLKDTIPQMMTKKGQKKKKSKVKEN